MNRFEKKCFITMACAHGLLVVILFVGPAFFMAPEKAEKNQLITVFDPKTVTDALSNNSGNPNVHAAPQAPPPLPPAAPPQPVHDPLPPETHTEPLHNTPKPKVTEPVKPEKLDPKSDVPTVKQTKHKVVLDKDALTSTTPSTTKPHPTAPRNTSRNNADSQEEADRKQLADRIGKTLKSIDRNISGATTIDTPGNGDKGPAAANYRDLVASKYTLAWNPPASLDDDTANVITSVTISRDGRVLRSHITKPSGNPTMDRSIQNTLDNVTFIEPFPADSNDRERTFTIKFNLQAKRNAG